MIISDTQLGERVRALRDAHSLTQDELAARLNLKRNAVGQIENGRRKMRFAEALKMAEVFGITPGALAEPGKDIEVVLEEINTPIEEKAQIRINVPQQNVAKFKEVLLHILNKVGSKANIGETVIYKLLYFIDFDFYEMYEEQLIGAAYQKNTYGPTPVEFAKIVRDMIADEEIEKTKREYHGYPQVRYLPLREPDLSILRGHETKVIDSVLNRLSGMNATQISEYSHGDIPWLTTDNNAIIEYESVFYRTPQYSVRSYD